VRCGRDRFVGFAQRDAERIHETDRLRGHADFADDQTLEIDGRSRVVARAVVIATGSRPVRADSYDTLGDHVDASDAVVDGQALPKSAAANADPRAAASSPILVAGNAGDFIVTPSSAGAPAAPCGPGAAGNRNGLDGRGLVAPRQCPTHDLAGPAPGRGTGEERGARQSHATVTAHTVRYPS
jgi:hypothetical protein